MTSLNRLIRMTIAYYDVFDMPLSSFETWKHLLVPDGEERSGHPIRLGEIGRALEEEVSAGRVMEEEGFYFLPGRDFLVGTRLREDKVAVSRLKRVRRLVRMLRFVPFLRMVGITGSLAIKKSGHESDWDLFLVLRSGRIFTGRTVITGFLHAIGKRRHGKKTCNRACLNYFVTEDGLTIGTKDLFSAHEYRFLIPFFGFHTYQRFERKNGWIRNFKPNFLPTEAVPLWDVRDTAFSRGCRRVGEAVLSSSLLERRLASWQKEKIRRNPKSSIPGGLIEANDRALVFLPEPRGPKVFERFKARLGDILIA